MPTTPATRQMYSQVLSAAAEVEGLVATLGCEEIDHSRCALSVPVRSVRGGRGRPRPLRCGALSTTAVDVLDPGRGRAGRSHPTPGRGAR